MNPGLKKPKGSVDSSDLTQSSAFPDEVLEKVLSLVESHKDRNSASLVCKDWYNAERWTRTKIFIGNCYSVTPEIVARRFPKIKSVILKGKPRFSDFNLVPQNWGAHIQAWLSVFVKVYPFLEELRLKRMTLSDESLEFLAKSFPGFKVLSLLSCDGFTTEGIEYITTHCKNLTELDIQENSMEEISGFWLSAFPDDFASLEVLNFASLNTEVSFDALERLVTRCKSLRVLKVNKNISLTQLQRLLARAPQLTELGTGAFHQVFDSRQYQELESAFSNCKHLHTLSGLWNPTPLYLRTIQAVCGRLTYLNMNDANIDTDAFCKLVPHCPNLRRLWVQDCIKDQGLEAVGTSCPLLEELRVFPFEPFDEDAEIGVTELGFVAVSAGCPKLQYVLYFCRQMTNAAVATVVKNCPDFTHFRLCIMNPWEPDHLTKQPMDEAFGAVVKTCTKLRRLSVSGLLTDLAFEYIGDYAKNLETLSVAFAGGTDWGMRCVLDGCPKLRKLEIRDSPFGNAALLSGLEKYESMRCLWMSACRVTMNGCRYLAARKPRLNVEVIKDEGCDDCTADKLYVYRSVAGPRMDAPDFVQKI